MNLTTLTAISPIDGRYLNQLTEIQNNWSEFAFIRYRLLVEIEWLKTLLQLKNFQTDSPLYQHATDLLDALHQNFSEEDAQAIKDIEKHTNHDVKAIEYYLKQQLLEIEALAPFTELIHFGCTSEDINNLAYGLMFKTTRQECLLPLLNNLIDMLKNMTVQHAHIPMLSRTHGQPASPTTVGKEFANFAARLQRQCNNLMNVNILGKFNGTIGNYNAHHFTCPHINWQTVSNQFVMHFGLTWNAYSTQIEFHDYIAELAHVIIRINNICIDFCRDMWLYISLAYFKQKIQSQETGSSVMPHKVNPIDFENAEGNLGIANALWDHFANKLPISRWQRDLSDSTVMRNLGVAFAHTLLSLQSIIKGINKLEINTQLIQEDLDQHWEVLAEALQTLMRYYNIPDAYEKIKVLSRGKQFDEQTFHKVVNQIDLPPQAKKQLKNIKPSLYLGYAAELAKMIEEETHENYSEK